MAVYVCVQARQILVVLVLLGVMLYQFALWMTHVDDFEGSPRCGNKEQLMVVATIVTYGDLIITLVIPSIIILFLMVAITVSLVRSFKRQFRLKVCIASQLSSCKRAAACVQVGQCMCISLHVHFNSNE